MSKLSELVAVRVMGAKVIDTIDPVPKGFYVRNHAAYYGDDAGRNRCECFMPATSIADAWRVVEKMRADGWLFTMQDAGTLSRDTVVWFQKAPDGMIEAEGVASGKIGTEPELICVAALRACGVSEDEITQARKDTP
jgi:hypothetical protein